MHLLAGYPGYIMDGGSFRHIPWFADYSGSGERGGSYMLEILKNVWGLRGANMLIIRKKYRKMKGLLISTFFLLFEPLIFLK